MKALVDNDILIKGSCYALLHDFVAGIPAAPDAVGLLGAAEFVVRSAILRRLGKEKSGAALDLFATFLKQTSKVEPSASEREMAAEFEFHAQKQGVALDSGESQLCAVLIARSIPLLSTGDKRATQAIERLIDHCPVLAALNEKVVSLEQIMLRTIGSKTPNSLRPLICREPSVDKTLSVCFACHSSNLVDEACLDGLRSYINALRKAAPRVLAPD
jgi:hypothetical protein